MHNEKLYSSIIVILIIIILLLLYLNIECERKLKNKIINK